MSISENITATDVSDAELEAAQRIVDEHAARRRLAAAAATQAEREARVVAALGPRGRWAMDYLRRPRDLGLHERVQKARARFVTAVEHGGFTSVRDAFVLYSKCRTDVDAAASKRHQAESLLHAAGFRSDGGPADPTVTPARPRMAYFTEGGWETFSEAFDAALDEVVGHSSDALHDKVIREIEAEVAALGS
jgi:hypothetical protein